MISNPSITAVFATMDRSQTAVSCVRALASQTRSPDRVVVADNVSTDETIADLEALENLPFELIVHRMDENRGNAGGVKEAMELAFSKGADAVWILDDDSWPRQDALKELIKGEWDPSIIRHSLQIDPATKRFTWPLQVGAGKRNWKLVDTLDDMPVGKFIPSRIIWTGALVSRLVREKTGPVNGELFIRGEDEEYPWRFEKAGFTQQAATRSIMDHPGPEDIVHWKFFGKSFFFERGLADWKLYYKVRNMVWLKKTQSGKIRAILMACTYAFGSSVIDGLQRLPLIWEAVCDGWHDRLGKWSGHT